METRFQSIGRSGIAYEILNYDQRIETWQARNGYLSAQVAEYQCYDDGLVRHSPPCLVYGDNIIDCMSSLALHAWENRTDQNLMHLIDSIWPSDIYADRIDFALSVKANPDKRRYYNIGDLKVSSSEKLQYDTRWALIPDWANGNFEATCRLLVPQYADGLSKFYYYNQLRDYKGVYGNIDGCLIGLTCETYGAEVNVLTGAFRAVDSLVKAERATRYAERSIESLRHNIENAKRLETAAA
jgi:hypothetical protein